MGSGGNKEKMEFGNELMRKRGGWWGGGIINSPNLESSGNGGRGKADGKSGWKNI